MNSVYSFIFLISHNGLAMVRVPQGMHYSRCCAVGFFYSLFVKFSLFVVRHSVVYQKSDS